MISSKCEYKYMLERMFHLNMTNEVKLARALAITISLLLTCQGQVG